MILRSVLEMNLVVDVVAALALMCKDVEGYVKGRRSAYQFAETP